MIRIRKGAIPPILKRNAKRWAAALAAAPVNPSTPAEKKLVDRLIGRYRHPDVLDALLAECYGKCAYCESKITHIAFSQIEHFRPKAQFRELTFEWTNLTLGCPRCNLSKSNHWDPELPFVNPYCEDPYEFFRAGGPYLYALPGNRRALFMIATIDLNRPDLIERRAERLKFLTALADLYARETNANLREILMDEIVEALKPDKEYSFVGRAYGELVGVVDR